MSSYKFKNQNVVDISITFPEDETKAFIEGLRKLSGRPFFQAKYIGAALGVAITPGLKALRKTTPKGPTGPENRKCTSDHIMGLYGPFLTGPKRVAFSSFSFFFTIVPFFEKY